MSTTTAFDAIMLQGVMQFLLALIIVGLVAYGLSRLFRKPLNERSRIYKNHLSNLYIASKIKELADHDNVDLALIEDNFAVYEEQEGYLKRKELEDVLEEEAIEKVNENIEKSRSEVKTKKK